MEGSDLPLVYCILLNPPTILSPASFCFVDRNFNLLSSWNPTLLMKIE